MIEELRAFRATCDGCGASRIVLASAMPFAEVLRYDGWTETVTVEHGEPTVMRSGHYCKECSVNESDDGR